MKYKCLLCACYECCVNNYDNYVMVFFVIVMLQIICCSECIYMLLGRNLCGMAQLGDGDSKLWYQSHRFNTEPAW
jgi:hypothetical protein